MAPPKRSLSSSQGSQHDHPSSPRKRLHTADMDSPEIASQSFRNWDNTFVIKEWSTCIKPFSPLTLIGNYADSALEFLLAFSLCVHQYETRRDDRDRPLRGWVGPRHFEESINEALQAGLTNKVKEWDLQDELREAHALIVNEMTPDRNAPDGHLGLSRERFLRTLAPDYLEDAVFILEPNVGDRIVCSIPGRLQKQVSLAGWSARASIVDHRQLMRESVDIVDLSRSRVRERHPLRRVKARGDLADHRTSTNEAIREKQEREQELESGNWMKYMEKVDLEEKLAKLTSLATKGGREVMMSEDGNREAGLPLRPVLHFTKIEEEFDGDTIEAKFRGKGKQKEEMDEDHIGGVALPSAPKPSPILTPRRIQVSNGIGPSIKLVQEPQDTVMEDQAARTPPPARSDVARRGSPDLDEISLVGGAEIPESPRSSSSLSSTHMLLG